MEREVKRLGRTDDTEEGPRDVAAVYGIPDRLERRMKSKLHRRAPRNEKNMAKYSNRIPYGSLDRYDNHAGIKMEPSSASRAPSCSITNVNNTIKTAVKRSLEDENASIVIKKKKMELPRPPNPPNCPKTNVKNRIKMVIRRSKENANVWVVIKREEIELSIPPNPPSFSKTNLNNVKK